MKTNKNLKLSVGYAKQKQLFLLIENPSKRFEKLCKAHERAENLTKKLWKEYMAFDMQKECEEWKIHVNELMSAVNNIDDSIDLISLNFY